MKVLTILALVICTVGILLNTGRSEETQQVDDIENWSPKREADVDDAFEKKDDPENDDDDDDDDESEDEEEKSNAFKTRDSALENSQATSNVADEPGLFKRFPGRRRRRRRRRRYRRRHYRRRRYRRRRH